MQAGPFFDFTMTPDRRLLVRGSEEQLLLMAKAFELAAKTGEFHVADASLVITRTEVSRVPMLTVH